MRIGLSDIPTCHALNALHSHILHGKLRESEIYELANQRDPSLNKKLEGLVECTAQYKQFQEDRNLINYFGYEHCVGKHLSREKQSDWVKCAFENGREGGDIRKCEYKKKLITSCLKESAEDLLRAFKSDLHRKKR